LLWRGGDNGRGSGGGVDNFDGNDDNDDNDDNENHNVRVMYGWFWILDGDCTSLYMVYEGRPPFLSSVGTGRSRHIAGLGRFCSKFRS
jgi:hypothetical protein